MDAVDFFAWRSQTTTAVSLVGDDEVAADVDEPPDSRPTHTTHISFEKAPVRPHGMRKESQLTKAFTQPSTINSTRPDIQLATDMARRKSTMSLASAASTAELTSDGGVTSPARTTTPSPPYPSSTLMKLAAYQLGIPPLASAPMIRGDSDAGRYSLPPVAEIADATLVNKPAPRQSMIRFACPNQPEPKRPSAVTFGPSRIGPQIAIESSKQPITDKPSATTDVTCASKPTRSHSRSPSVNKKLRPSPLALKSRESISTIRQPSKSPLARRGPRPKFISATEDKLEESEATMFHEFALDSLRDDDWIRRERLDPKKRITIKDTLGKENRLRQLGREAEEEALEEEDDDDEEDDDEDDEEDEADAVSDSDEDNDDGKGVEEDVDEHENAEAYHVDIDSGPQVESDGNETDNEAGFAESDDESEGEDALYQFWPSVNKANPIQDSNNTVRPSAMRTVSESSIDSLKHMSPVARMKKGSKSRNIPHRPGTPDLPDSTDFVCGTLDEDRPLEDAYVSCMEARKREKRHVIPQDIDPSFPASDLGEDDEGDDDDLVANNESEVDDDFIHGKFEESEDEALSRRASRTSSGHRTGRLRSPAPRKVSPPATKRLVSPPPKGRRVSPITKRVTPPPPSKHIRARSPPPRRLFGHHSPRRMRSPPPSHAASSPPSSLTRAMPIPPPALGVSRGVTHTKSLPRTPNAFCRAYRASRLVAAKGTVPEGHEARTPDGTHTRGAIDIIKGLERKNARRAEKMYQKQCNKLRRAGGHAERKPLPGKGAQRMKEIGLSHLGAAAKKDVEGKGPLYMTSM